MNTTTQWKKWLFASLLAGSISVATPASASWCCGYCPEPERCPPCQLYCGGFWVGLNYGSYSGDDWAIMAGWNTTWFLADIGYSYERTNVHSSDTAFHLHEVRGHLGSRCRLCCSNLFVTYGALGSYGYRSTTSDTRTIPYEIGAFVGLDYQPIRHFLISGKIAPYVYERSFNRNTNRRVVAEGSLTLAYVI